MLDVLIGLVLVAAGFVLGRRTVPERLPAPTVAHQELHRLQEDRAAFAQLMGYSAERAYGMEEE